MNTKKTLPDFLKVLGKFRDSFLLKNYLYICGTVRLHIIELKDVIKTS